MKSRFIFTMFVFVMASMPVSVLADPTAYVCVVAQSVGFHFDGRTNKWTPMTFRPGEKYILRHLNSDDWKGKYHSELKQGADWAFFDFEGMPQAVCFDTHSSKNLLDIPPPFSCESVIGNVSFDKDSGRFEYVVHGGYTEQAFWERVKQEDPTKPDVKGAENPAHPDDLFIDIGKCTATR